MRSLYQLNGILNLEKMVEKFNNIKQKNDDLYQNSLMRLAPSKENKSERGDYWVVEKKTKIKKNKKNDKVAQKWHQNFAESDDGDQCYQLRHGTYDKAKLAQIGERIFDCLTELILRIQFIKGKRKQLSNLKPRQFLSVIKLIESQFQVFIDQLHASDQVDQQLDDEKIADALVENLMSLSPGLKEGLEKHRTKLALSEQYKHQYKQLLRKKVLPRIVKNKILEDYMRDQSQEDAYCIRDQQIQKFSATTLKKLATSNQVTVKIQGQSFKIGRQGKQHMHPQPYPISSSESEEVKPQKKKKKNRKKKKKQKVTEQPQLSRQQRENQTFNILCQNLEKLQINPDNWQQCRVDDTFMKKLSKKSYQITKQMLKNSSKLNQSSTQHIFEKN